MEWITKQQADSLNKNDYDSINHLYKQLHNQLVNSYEREIQILKKRIESLEGFFLSSERNIASALTDCRNFVEKEREQALSIAESYRKMMVELNEIIKEVSPSTLKCMLEVAKVFDSIRGDYY